MIIIILSGHLPGFGFASDGIGSSTRVVTGVCIVCIDDVQRPWASEHVSGKWTEREIKVMDIAGFGFDKNKLSGEIRKLEIHIPL